MSIEKRLLIKCDECGETVEVTSHNWPEIKECVVRKGWTIISQSKKSGKQFCPGCSVGNRRAHLSKQAEELLLVIYNCGVTGWCKKIKKDCDPVYCSAINKNVVINKGSITIANLLKSLGLVEEYKDNVLRVTENGVRRVVLILREWKKKWAT
jgi:hypothetical protein